ncbi:hypothetical protein ABH920_000602 [Catenulispora sp. EB89]|uniref:hypothetical protein n=1 Tax=Catenulispora sp. EB89 TaxID=3156257 RepID=UPI003517E35B
MGDDQFGTARRDPEDEFTLPSVYDGRTIVDRSRFAFGKHPEMDRSGAERVLAQRQQRDSGLLRLIEQARTSPESDLELVEALSDVDVFDLAAQSPLQAALIAMTIRASEYSNTDDDVADVEIWECARDLAFAVEAFAHFCHLDSTGRS